MKQGPLKKHELGQIWAKAFSDPNFQTTLEKSPKLAAEDFFGEEVERLFTMYDNSYISYFLNTVNEKFTEEERKAILDGSFDTNNDTNNQRQRYRDLLDKVKGNQFFLSKNGTPICHLDPQNIDGSPGPSFPLTRNDWVKVYTKARLEDEFRKQLEKDPAKAIEEFRELGHAANTPIFKFPTLDELNERLPTGDPLKNDRVKLIETLRKIADGSEPVYQATVEVTLTC